MVTNDIFVSFWHCDRKAFLLAWGTPGHPAEIETVQLELERVYLRQALETFLAADGEQDVVKNPPSLEASIKSSPRAIIDVIASGNGMSSQIQALERMKKAVDDDDAVYSPVLFTLNEKVSRANKLLLAFNAIALSSVQGTLPSIGKIVHGSSYKVLKCKIKPLVGEVRKLVAQIQAAHVDGVAAPPVRLNRHCNVCQFQADCQRLADADIHAPAHEDGCLGGAVQRGRRGQGRERVAVSGQGAVVRGTSLKCWVPKCRVLRYVC